jgi:hypothetical protein
MRDVGTVILRVPIRTYELEEMRDVGTVIAAVHA